MLFGWLDTYFYLGYSTRSSAWSLHSSTSTPFKVGTAKIYSSVYRVIVWLGEKAEDTDGALENICFAANRKFTEQSKKETIFNLLQRPWFQRIWEVAAA
ncbi:hypothetical protein DL98DRAFT_599039 [Cadophora sp. DSE1049]|nr:hypothetical protein DL98DRAFT_599039 [Cadophora sp. DSE1049]